MRRFRCAGEEPQPDGLCDCCWRTWRDGQRMLSPGVYWWLTKVGNLFLLCIECCAEWRKGAAEDPSLEPERITQAASLTPVTVTP